MFLSYVLILLQNLVQTCIEIISRLTLKVKVIGPRSGSPSAKYVVYFFFFCVATPQGKLKADRPHTRYRFPTHRQTLQTGNDSFLMQAWGYCSLLHSAKPSPKYRLLRSRNLTLTHDLDPNL